MSSHWFSRVQKAVVRDGAATMEGGAQRRHVASSEDGGRGHKPRKVGGLEKETDSPLEL